MVAIISKPSKEQDVSHLDQENQFGYSEVKGPRPTQEDALAFHSLKATDLQTQSATPLSPQEIGHRLWTSYQLLEKPELSGGTTASTTIYDGQGNLITATLADAATFAVVYDKSGNPLGVIRLNSVTHKPTNDEEKARIEALNTPTNRAFVYNNRVNGILAISRGIGDNSLKNAGVVPDATIDITSEAKIAADLSINPDDIGSIQLITTCDGFTDAADYSDIEHANYLLKSLQAMQTPGKQSEEKLALALTQKALDDGSQDNVSVAVKTLKKGYPFLMGVYDGHGGNDASHHVADHIGDIFKAQCALNPEMYARQENSVDTKKQIYERDNYSLRAGPRALLPEHLASIVDADLKETVQKLLTLTNELDKQGVNNPRIHSISSLLRRQLNDKGTNAQNIINFYQTLNMPSLYDQSLSNLEIIKQDKTADRFILGITILAATILTGILPGLLVIAIVYAATGLHPFNTLKSNSTVFEENLTELRSKPSVNGIFSAAFRAENTAQINKSEDPNQDNESTPSPE